MRFACSMNSAKNTYNNSLLYLSFAKNFNKFETRAVIKSFFPAMQSAHGISRHSERNFRGRCKFVYHRQKMCGQLSVVIFPPLLRLALDDRKQWPPQKLPIKFTS